VVTRVLGATHPFAALGLPPRETEAGSVKAAYRKAALAVHPDPCAARGGEACRSLRSARRGTRSRGAVPRRPSGSALGRRCRDPRAERAFKALTKAFEALAGPAEQRAAARRARPRRPSGFRCSPG
jgi:curved DNA-binding protein CbpA